MTIYRWILLRMRNISNKRSWENQTTHFQFSNFLPENRAVYEIMLKSVVETKRPQMAIWGGALHAKLIRLYGHKHKPVPVDPHPLTHAQALTHARVQTHTYTHTHTHTQKYVVIIAFPRQQWFRKLASLLRYMYIACFAHLLFLFCKQFAFAVAYILVSH